MKNILIAGKKVSDVAGLYYDLIKGEFQVENVGVDQSGTHVFLNDSEQKDPTPVVEAWLSKPVQPPSRSTVDQRKTINAEYQVKRAQKEAEARVKEYGSEMSPALVGTPVITGPKSTIFSKIFRKLW